MRQRMEHAVKSEIGSKLWVERHRWRLTFWQTEDIIKVGFKGIDLSMGLGYSGSDKGEMAGSFQNVN
jgi:hypothetical protein